MNYPTITHTNTATFTGRDLRWAVRFELRNMFQEEYGTWLMSESERLTQRQRDAITCAVKALAWQACCDYLDRLDTNDRELYYGMDSKLPLAAFNADFIRYYPAEAIEAAKIAATALDNVCYIMFDASDYELSIIPMR